MNLLRLFGRRNSAPVARERLQILLSHERVLNGKTDLVAILQEEILAVVAKHVPIEREKIQIKLERGEAVSLLEIDIEVPSPVAKPASEAIAPRPVVAPVEPAALKPGVAPVETSVVPEPVAAPAESTAAPVQASAA